MVVGVSNIKRSKEFYRRVLGFLGFKMTDDYGAAVGFKYDKNGLKTRFWITLADKVGRKHKHRKGEVGFHHYAFELGSRKDVDELYTKVLKPNKVKIIDRPQDFPQYGKGYYFVSFIDPDNIKLEAMVFRPDQVPKEKRRNKN